MDRPIILIGGPTASGKNQVALKLAQHLPVELVNADSRQIYRGLVIGTNQPDPQELDLVPHHLYCFLEPFIPFTAADFEREAVSEVKKILARGSFPVLVGGTGFYMKAFLKGTWDIPARDPRLRQRLRRIESRRGKKTLHCLLQRIDPASAAVIAENDVYRVIRALEIYFQTGKQRSRFQMQSEDRFHTIRFYLDPDRAQLHETIRLRIERMFQHGWMEEVRQLLERYPGFEHMPAAASLGYTEIIRFLKGKLAEAEMKEEIVRKTAKYAKRQLTWFRNQDRFRRLDAKLELHKLVESVLEWIDAK